MNLTENNENKTAVTTGIDASCRVPLLALFGGAALCLVLGMLLSIVAAMSFHKPDMFANCAFLSYGRAQAAANDLLLYGFVIPAALGVMLWIFTRLSQAPLALPIVPVFAANLWFFGVFIGTLGILLGHSTGYLWLEYPRAAAVLIFAAFMLIAVSAAATMGFRADREMYPSHWFLFAALLWFAWAYSSTNLFLLPAHPPRGVVQAIIGWWFANNLLFVWLALAGLGIAFYLLPKFAGKPLASTGYLMFGFLTLIFFGTWCGIPHGAPVPAWLPATSTYAGMLSFFSILAIAVVAAKTVCGSGFTLDGGPFCFIKFGTWSFVLSALLYLAGFWPHWSFVTSFTWYNFGVTQFQVLGFAGMILCGAIYHILPRVLEKELPYAGLAKLNFYLFVFGLLFLVVPLLIGGVEQGMKLNDAKVGFADVSAAALTFIRVSTGGQFLILLGSLCLSLNIFVMTIRWKLGFINTVVASVKAPLEPAEVKP